MKEQTSHPTALKTANDSDLMVATINNYHNDPDGSRDKLDWSPSSPTSCQESVDLSDADSDSSPVSIDSHVVLNTFNTPPQDSDSEDYDSWDGHDLNPSDGFEFDSWTLASPKSTSSAQKDGKLVITQVPLKNRTLVVDTEENDDELHDFTSPKKRQKTMHSMLPRLNQPFGTFSVNDDNDMKSTTKRKSAKISFRETVDVLSIPARYEYSSEMRSQLWSSILEINENAARNTIEFASEGWDWRNVTLDIDMCHCPATGQSIHPVHCGHPGPVYHTAYTTNSTRRD